MSKELRKPTVGAIEVRHLPTTLEFRGEGDEKKGIGGIGIATGVVADIGYFTESIDHGALDDVLDMDVRGLFNHNEDFLLGRTSAGTMELKKVEAGLDYEIPNMPDARADVMEMVTRGDLTGSSFSFIISEDKWRNSETDEDTGLTRKPHRTILKFQRVFDTGPVAFPAYEGDATVSARSLRSALEAGAEIPPELLTEGSQEGGGTGEGEGRQVGNGETGSTTASTTVKITSVGSGEGGEERTVDEQLDDLRLLIASHAAAVTANRETIASNTDAITATARELVELKESKERISAALARIKRQLDKDRRIAEMEAIGV